MNLIYISIQLKITPGLLPVKCGQRKDQGRRNASFPIQGKINLKKVKVEFIQQYKMQFNDKERI